MKIIDAQIHIWAQTVTPQWSPQVEIHRRGGAEGDGRAGVDGALIHPPIAGTRPPTSSPRRGEEISTASPSWASSRSTIESRKRIVGGATSRA